MYHVKSEFIREQKRYTKKELMKILGYTETEFEKFVKKLKLFGILKLVNNNSEQKQLSDLIDYDIEIGDSIDDTSLYVFTYVGIIVFESRVITCYPKYLTDIDKPINEMKQILKVIKKYDAKEQVINLYNGEGEDKKFNLLAVMLFLIADYYEFDIYNNTKDIINVNGDTEILWDKTINENFALIRNNRPLYLEYFTRSSVDDENDFYRKLHESVLKNCFQRFKVFNLLEIFELEDVEFDVEDLEELGDSEYLLYKLDQEINIQFNTRKQILLKTLYAYIEHINNSVVSDNISMYGTNSFNLVWEKVCAVIFDNKLNIPLGKLPLCNGLASKYDENKKLIEIIDKPLWRGFDNQGETFDKNAKDTLKPDIISILTTDKGTEFVILDAKYYTIQLEKEKEIRNYPGVNDIIKQYLYQLAYKQFIEDNKFTIVKNCFIMPTKENKVIKKAVANISFLSNSDLEDIQVRLIPAKFAYQQYINNNIVNTSILNL